MSQPIILEPRDITALRLAETRPFYFQDPLLTSAGFTLTEYRQRLNRLTTAGIIRSFHLTLFIPPLLGGNWVWAGIMTRADQPYETAHQLIDRIPFITEILFNTCFPANLGPNLALLLFSRDLETETRFIQTLPGVRETQVFKINEYPFPVSLPLSGEEKALIRFLLQHPDTDAETIAANFGQSLNWIRAKLDRLLWTQDNRNGIIRIQPSINWSNAENFGHFHFLLETGYRPDQLAPLIADHNFTLIMSGTLISNRYLGVEADVWGIADLFQRLEFLEHLHGVRVAALIYNQEVLINDHWVSRTIGA
ncbi:MAG: hypothetical protein ACP5PK_07825 [candidate division WOR-3 bacterium]